MLFRVVKIKFFIYCIPFISLILGGCTDNGLLFRSLVQYEQTQSDGTYYIGDPYTIRGVRYIPAEDYNYREKGAASWYRRDDAHRLTTNGEIFDEGEMTAAHKTLPLPSLVRITNLENGNVAIVRVNDRGPNVNNRLIDVSQKAAAALEFQATGTTMVEVEVLADESRRLKEMALGKTTKTSLIEEKNLNESLIPLGSEQVVYQPDVAVMPLYEEVVLEEPIVETSVVSLETEKPLDLVGESFETTTSSNTTVVSEGLETSKDETVLFQEKNLESSIQNVEEFVPVLQEGYVIQIGAFANKANIERVSAVVSDLGTVIKAPRGELTIVRIGPFKNEEIAREVLDKVHQAGYGDAIVQFQK